MVFIVILYCQTIVRRSYYYLYALLSWNDFLHNKRRVEANVFTIIHLQCYNKRNSKCSTLTIQQSLL